MHIRVHTANARASCARPFGLFLHPLAAPQGAPFGGILPQKPKHEQKPEQQQRRRIPNQLHRRSPWMDGNCAKDGAVRGAEHRRCDGKLPEGSRRWIAAIAKQYTDVLSEQPRHGEKRRGF